MAMRSPTARRLAALLLLTGLPWAAARAKPPDLPAQPTIDCRPACPCKPGGCPCPAAQAGDLIGRTLLPAPTAVAEEGDQDFGAVVLDTLGSCLSEVFDACWQPVADCLSDADDEDAPEAGRVGLVIPPPGSYAEGVTSLPIYVVAPDGSVRRSDAVAFVHIITPEDSVTRAAERRGRLLCVQLLPSDEDAAEESEAPTPPASDCPYLRDQAAGPQHSRTVAETTDLSAGVLENLQKLELAARLCKEAEHYERRGYVQDASHCYELAGRICPGSRYAALAREKLLGLRAHAASEAGPADAEEQEYVPAPKVPTPEVIPAPHPSCPDDEVLRPVLPAVDSSLAEGLHDVLIRTPSSGEVRLVVEEVPSAEAPCGGCALLRDAWEALCGSCCVEVDPSQPAGLRARCRVQLPCLEVDAVLCNSGLGNLGLTCIPLTEPLPQAAAKQPK